MWLLEVIQELAQLSSAKRFYLDMCRFGSAHKKPTALLASYDLSPVALACDKADRPHVHEPLTGMVMLDGKKVFKTRIAQVYPDRLCSVWAQCLRGGHSDPLQATYNWALPPADRKRPLGQPVPWSGHKQKISAEKAVAAGYQLKRSALPPLFQVEMDPGQAVQTALEMDHPFSVPPALEPDLQEALSMIVHRQDQLSVARQAALTFWETRASSLLDESDRELRQIPDPWLRQLLRGVKDEEPPALGVTTHIALWREMLREARCIDHFLLEEILWVPHRREDRQIFPLDSSRSSISSFGS